MDLFFLYVKLTAELATHFPGPKNIDEPIVWIFPELVVCVDCGIAEFAIYLTRPTEYERTWARFATRLVFWVHLRTRKTINRITTIVPAKP